MEQAERLLSHTRAKKVVHVFALNPLYNGAYLDNDYMITQLPLVLIFYDSIPSSVAQEVQQLTIAEQVYYTFDCH